MSSVPRFSAPLVAALVLSFAPPLTAASQSEDRMASWALSLEDCSATLITPRVALTTSRCAAKAKFPNSGAALTFIVRRTGQAIAGEVFTPAILADLPPSGLALIRVASELSSPVAPIPSYLQEAALLKNPKPGQSREVGRRFYAFGVSRYDSYAWHFGPSPGERSFDVSRTPLTYRTLDRLRSSERTRFQARPLGLDWDDVLGDHVTRALRGQPARSADELLIALAGTVQDGMTLRRPRPPMPGWGQLRGPFLSADEGSGLLATDKPVSWFVPGGKLAGLVGGDGLLHMRLSAHWPAIHRAMREQGWNQDAEIVARQVLALEAFDTNRRGRPGQFYQQMNPSSGQVEFFRLKQVDADGTYPAMPSPGQGDTWWDHLGAALPTRAQVLRWHVEARARAQARAAETEDAASRVTPLPGTDPVLPAPSATRR